MSYPNYFHHKSAHGKTDREIVDLANKVNLLKQLAPNIAATEERFGYKIDTDDFLAQYKLFQTVRQEKGNVDGYAEFSRPPKPAKPDPRQSPPPSPPIRKQKMGLSERESIYGIKEEEEDEDNEVKKKNQPSDAAEVVTMIRDKRNEVLMTDEHARAHIKEHWIWVFENKNPKKAEEGKEQEGGEGDEKVK